MPKIQPQNELDQVAAVVSQYPDGIAASGIAASLPLISAFNLKRRLTKLVADKRIDMRGIRRGAKYFPAAQKPKKTESIPLSTEAKTVQALVHRSITQRRPVGYARVFLDDYRPNETWYLPLPIREQLRAAGAAPAQMGEAGTYARKILERLLIDLAWNSSRLEGNTYSLLDTQKLIAHGRTAEGKDARDAQMILNHKQAIEYLVDSAETISFDRLTLLNLHALLSQNLLANPAAEGTLRSIDIGITNSTFMPLSTPQLVEECFQQFVDTARAIIDPFEQAFFTLVHLPYLQPFEDVNKRVSRLAANIPFIKYNLVPISFVDVPQDVYIDGLLVVYENNRIELLRDVFIWAYERSASRYAAVRQTIGDPDPFRLAYRSSIFAAITEVVREALNVNDANRRIRLYAAKNVPVDDQTRFIEIVETEIINLHAGNIARYQLRPSEFTEWLKRKIS